MGVFSKRGGLCGEFSPGGEDNWVDFRLGGGGE